MLRVKLSGAPDRAGAQLVKIAVPVGFEFFLFLSLAFISQIIVGNLGSSAIAAVGLANAIHTIPLLLLGALNIAAGVVVGRPFGGCNKPLTSRAVTYSVVLPLVTGAAVALPFVFFLEDIFRLAGASTQVVAQGSGYLAAMLASLPFGILAVVLGSVLRSVNRSRSPMVATIVMVVVNIPLATVLVYGAGPIPALGVVGVGIATIISLAARATALVVQVYLVYDVANWKWPVGQAQWRELGKPILRLAIPLGFISFSWTVGNFLYNVIIQQLGDGPLAALQIVSSFSGLFVLGSFGLASAITVSVSQVIRAGRPGLATVWIKYLLRLGGITGVGFAGLFALSSMLSPVFLPQLARDVLSLAIAGVLIKALVQPLTVRMLLFGSVLPAGNDNTGIIIGDFSGPYLVGIPLTLILVFLTPLGVLGAIIGRGGEDIVKLVVFACRPRRDTISCCKTADHG